MKYALLTTAMLGLASPALAQAPGTPEYTAHEAAIRDCVIEKVGGHDAFGKAMPSSPLHPTMRAVKPTDPHAPQFQVDLGLGNRKPPPSVVVKEATVSETDLRKYMAQCRHENP